MSESGGHTDSQPQTDADVSPYVVMTSDVAAEPEAPEPESPPGALSARWRRRERLAWVLFFVTCFSTWLVGGLWYSAAVMLILLAHEMGHYLQARRYKVPATLPFFIPMPLSPFGTMGAVILQGARSADRKVLFDIAITGPLAGLVIALPVLAWGMSESYYYVPEEGERLMHFGDPLIVQWVTEAFHGPRPEGADIRFPAEGPGSMTFAGWVGIFITALNLIPVGQLDGGHILYCLIGRRAHYIALAILGAAITYSVFVNMSYIVLVVLLLLMGPRHPPTGDDSVPLGRTRVILGWLTLAFVVIGLTPQPIILPS